MAKTEIRIEHPYNPLEKENLGKSVADALLERELGPLPAPERFIAAGVYAVYYTGPFHAYALLVQRNQRAAKRGRSQNADSHRKGCAGLGGSHSRAKPALAKAVGGNPLIVL